MRTATVAVTSVAGTCCPLLYMATALILYVRMYQFYLKYPCILVVGDKATNFICMLWNACIICYFKIIFIIHA